MEKDKETKRNKKERKFRLGLSVNGVCPSLSRHLVYLYRDVMCIDTHRQRGNLNRLFSFLKDGKWDKYEGEGEKSLNITASISLLGSDITWSCRCYQHFRETYPPTRSHGITTQKTMINTFTTTTSNLRCDHCSDLIIITSFYTEAQCLNP
jgi:hypothetical protein